MRSRHKLHLELLCSDKLFLLFIFCLYLVNAEMTCFAQQPASTSTQFTNNPPVAGYLKNSSAFRQEIARMEINVVRDDQSLPITQVPRVQKGDVIRARLLDEPVNGIKPDQSYWNWTFLVAFVNPSRNMAKGQGKEESVSEEIQFRKTGWYKEYSFVVPYDSQPVFFLYPKPKYRGKILRLINRKYEDIQKLGERTVELSGTYAQIGAFLNELQGVLARTQASIYGSFITYPNQTSPARTPYTSGNNNYNNRQLSPVYNYNAFLEQTIERLAQSFNIQLPACWQTPNGNVSYNGYNVYSSGNNNNLSRQNNFGYNVGYDLIGRAQCVAKNIRIEDFDLSVSRLLKEGGIFALTQLRDKYPQLAYWISIAAAAIDFILKVFQKSPLRIVPTIVQTNNYSATVARTISSATNYQAVSPPAPNSAATNSLAPTTKQQQQPSPLNRVKISLFAEAQPSEQGFVTAYPIVLQKWQANADPQIVDLPAPGLLEPCLHAGSNILKNTNLSEDSAMDSFTKDLRLLLSSSTGFKKEFPLKKNVGMGGWELNLTNEDFTLISKVQTTLEAEIQGTRGFNEIRSQKFVLPVPANCNQ